MTEDEAFALLGLDKGASTDDIGEAFRRAAKSAHPDAHGSDEAMSRLTQARDIAVRSVAPSMGLIPISTVHELMRMQERSMVRAEARADSRERTQRVVEQLVRHETSGLARRKRVAQAVGALAGGATVVTGVLRAVVLTTPSDKNFFATLIVALAVATAVFALMAWMTNIWVSQAQQLIEDATEALSDRGTYLSVLHEIERVSATPLPLLDDEFRSALEAWIASLGYQNPGTIAGLASRVGPADFSRLLIAKGVELDILNERIREVSGRRRIEYDLSPTDS